MNAKSNVIPSHIANSPYWRGTICLFQNHSKLERFFTTKYFDMDAGRIKVQSLKRTFSPYSTSEKIMLNLALHLFNDSNKFNLSDLDYLDRNNKELALKAIKLRFF